MNKPNKAEQDDTNFGQFTRHFVKQDEPIMMSDGSPMDTESVKRSDEKWSRSHQGRMIAERKAKSAQAETGTHSPLPWYSMASANPSELHPMVSIWSGRETKESIVCNSCSPSDAKLIIRCVNNAERLAEALRRIAAREWSDETVSWRSEAIEMQDEAREAVAAWEEGR